MDRPARRSVAPVLRFDCWFVPPAGVISGVAFAVFAVRRAIPCPTLRVGNWHGLVNPMTPWRLRVDRPDWTRVGSSRRFIARR